jgi:hypothetical protein
MKKSLIILEGLERSRRSKFLRKVEKTIKTLERIVWIVPFIKKLDKTSQVFVVSRDYEISKFLERFGVSTIESEDKKFNKNEIEHMFEKSMELFDKLYRYRNMSDETTYLDVNTGVVLQADFVNLFFDRIKELKYVQNLVKDVNPTSIYVENINSSMGQIVMSVAESNQIKVFSILPELYGKLKNKIIKYLLYTRYRIPYIHANTLHLMSLNNGNGKRKVLAYAPYINFIDAIFPVIKVLSENNIYKKIYILGKKEEILRYSKDFVDTSITIENVDISKEIAKMKQYFSQVFRDDAFHEIFEHESINFWRSIKYDLYYIFHNRLASLMSNLKECEVVLKNVNPDMLLVGDDRPPHIRTCVLLAKNKKIPTMEIQHGIYSRTKPQSAPVSDKVCALGDYARDVLITAGGTDDQIVVTGCPKFDSLFDKKKLRYLPGSKKQCKKILFATQYVFEDVIIGAIEKIIPFLSVEQDVYLIIKPHPAEKPELYRRFSKKYKKVIVEDSKANIDDLLLDADVLVTIGSTVGINAAILDVPMVLLNFNKTASLYIPISLEVRDIEDIIPAIKDALYNKEVLQRLADSRKKFVYEHAYIQDGQASKRVADLIENMVKESKKPNLIHRKEIEAPHDNL